jgi:uncharacterized lipoprotein YmbA
MIRTLLSLSLFALIAGCSLLEPREDPTRYFVLSPTQAPTAAASTPLERQVVVGPLDLPDYLERPEIVLRSAPNEIEPSPVDRWAEQLDGAIMRVLCIDLAQLMPTTSVVAFPTKTGEKPALQIEIALLEFGADTDGMTRLEGRWTTRAAADGSRVTRAFRYERPTGDKDTKAIVAAMSALLAELAQAIATDVDGAPAH